MAENNNAGKPAQDFVPIEEIRDGVVILKDHSMRLVLLVSSLNFALKSADEQMAILMQFQNFLNSLDFHIQISIESRRLDIKPYLRTLEEQAVSQTNELLKVQTREYIEFIKKFTETVDIMEKKFFVVVPYTPPILTSASGKSFISGLFGKKTKAQTTAANATKQTDFEEHRTQLEQRAAVVSQGFSGLGLRVAQLGTEELVELYFKIFNPGDSNIPRINI